MQEYIVSNLEDENDGDFSEGNLSLREAISTSSDGDTITFDSNLSGGTITLTQGELTVDKNLTIQGLGEENIIIDGGDFDPLLSSTLSIMTTTLSVVLTTAILVEPLLIEAGFNGSFSYFTSRAQLFRLFRYPLNST